jgi:aminoglycoside phosphotransferase (APT) family kinase protein
VTDPAALDHYGGLLDWYRLGAWIDAQDLPGRGPVTSVVQLAGGTQNAVFRLDRSGTTMVLRRPPRRMREGSNATIRREARVLDALAATDVPSPRLLARCDDESVIGACFYVMSEIPGFTPGGELPDRYDQPAARRSMAFELVDGAVSLALVDPEAVGLGDLGRPDGWIERQVDRWRSQLEDYLHLPGYSEIAIPHVDVVGAWLDAHRPSAFQPGLVHGDYQFANVIYAHDRVELRAIVDWELTTLGDPLLDLGWILASWHEPGDPPGHFLRIDPWGTFPTRSELVQHYLDRTGRDSSAVPWYYVLACYKLGILLEGTYARAMGSDVVSDVAERLHGNARWLLTNAERLCR